MKPDELVVRFLSNIGRPGEVDVYLQLFRAARPESFAILAVSDSVLQVAAGALVTDLGFLSSLGLRPVVVLGLVAPRKATATAHLLSEWLSTDVPHRIVTGDIAAETARSGVIPLVPLDSDGARSTDAQFAALAALATDLGTRKVVFLGRRSGFRPVGQPTPSLVDVTTEYDALAAPGALPVKQAALLAQVRTLLGAVPHRMTVSVTSPLDLLRELFTERGAGTLIRRGSTVRRATSLSDVDRPRLDQLIRTAFGRPLAPTFWERPFERVYIADDYRGASVVAATPLGSYLTKFAVDAPARGEGVGRDLWRAMQADYPVMFWRSRAGNPLNSWYALNCDGMQRGSTWHVFWRGLDGAAIPAALDYAGTAPVDL